MGVPLTPEEGAALTGLAAAAIAARLAGHPLAAAAPEAPALREPGAAFVTLTAAGCLRGCIGSLLPARPLYQDVIRNAVRAAADPRLPPVTAGDWPDLDLSVSVLSPVEELAGADPASLRERLRPGVDGLILAQGSRRATFLPTVWQRYPEAEQFVAALLAKGGWRDWPPGLTASRYTTVEYRLPASDRAGRPDGSLEPHPETDPTPAPEPDLGFRA